MKTSCFVAVILFLWGGVLIGLGKEVIGTTVLQETYIPKKQVDIYYMPYSAGMLRMLPLQILRMSRGIIK